MEKLQNIGQLCRQHYEKIILSVALLLLAGAVIYLFNESKTQAGKIREIPIGYEKKKVNPVQPVELSGFLAVLKQAEKPFVLDFSGPHNLFNPVQWRINKGSTTWIKVVSPDLVGPQAMRIIEIRPVHLSVAFGQAVSSGTGEQLVVNGYWMFVTNEMAAIPKLRINRLFMSVNATNKDAPFILREAKGSAQEPEQFAAEFKEAGEKFSFAPAKPYFKIIGNEANLRYPASTNTTGFVRKGAPLDIDGQPYKVVDITPNEVVLSDDSNGKLHSITKFVAP
jgi:hypothetical protein